MYLPLSYSPAHPFRILQLCAHLDSRRRRCSLGALATPFALTVSVKYWRAIAEAAAATAICRFQFIRERKRERASHKRARMCELQLSVLACASLCTREFSRLEMPIAVARRRRSAVWPILGLLRKSQAREREREKDLTTQLHAHILLQNKHETDYAHVKFIYWRNTRAGVRERERLGC